LKRVLRSVIQRTIVYNEVLQGRVNRMSALPHAPRRIQIEELDAGVIVARFVGDDLGLFGREDARELFDLVERADRDPGIRAVVFTGSHPHRFISHADLRWLQEDGSVIPPVGRRVTSAVARIAHQFGCNKLTRWAASKTPLMGAVQLDHMHETLVRMTTSSTIFVAALNGSALGMGAELSWASGGTARISARRRWHPAPPSAHRLTSCAGRDPRRQALPRRRSTGSRGDR